MHWAFDRWMTREHPGCPFERYADLCRVPHKSAYAEPWIMPSCPVRVLARAVMPAAGSA
jgi:hypothetical protein